MAIKKIADSPSSDQGGRIIHKVRKGETLSSVASRYHTTVSNIKRWNGLRGNTIKVGQRLKIYGKSSGGSSSSSSVASSSGSSSGSSTYVVRKGDTLLKTDGVEHGCVCLEEGVLIDVFSPYREDFVDD